jgi:hypothetical protein
MPKSTKAAAKRHTIASVADEVAELRSGLAEVLALLKGEAVQRRAAGTGELRGEERGGDDPFTISAAAERARRQLREEIGQIRAAIEESLEELREEEGR